MTERLFGNFGYEFLGEEMDPLPDKYKGLLPDESSGEIVAVDYQFWKGATVTRYENKTELHVAMSKWWYIWHRVILWFFGLRKDWRDTK